MHAWAGLAIAQAVLIAISLWRMSNRPNRRVWWPGAGLFAIAALAPIVLVRDDGYGTAIAIFATVVLAVDALLLGSELAASLCTRPEEPA